jgi:hypothetical protein
MRTIAISLLLLLTAGAARSDNGDSPEARRAAAERYYTVSDFPRLLDQSVSAAARSQDPQHAEQAAVLIKKHLRTDVLASVMLNAMVKNFTADELNALADFYGSPVGKSAMAKFPGYLGDVMPGLLAEMRRAGAEISQEAETKRNSHSGT